MVAPRISGPVNFEQIASFRGTDSADAHSVKCHCYIALYPRPSLIPIVLFDDSELMMKTALSNFRVATI